MKALLLLLSTLIVIAFVTGNVHAQTEASAGQLASTEITTAAPEEIKTPVAAYKSNKLNENGILTDTNNVILGNVAEDGTLKNAGGMVIGKIVKNKKDVTMYDFYNNKGKIVATVGPHGIVKDMSGKILYTVEEPDASGYCEVRDAKNRLVGVVHESRRHEGACMIMQAKKKV